MVLEPVARVCPRMVLAAQDVKLTPVTNTDRFGDFSEKVGSLKRLVLMIRGCGSTGPASSVVGVLRSWGAAALH